MEIDRLNWLDFILLSVACWRLCHLIVKDHGPWDILDKLRDRFPLGGLTTCVYCLSIWFSVILVSVHVLLTTWPTWFFAVAGGALMLRSYTGVGLHDNR